MKKVLFLSALAFFSLSVAQAQKFELQLSGATVNGSSGVVHVVYGEQVTIGFTLKNLGAFPLVSGNYQQTNFPGGTYSFAVNVSKNGTDRSKIAITRNVAIPSIVWNGTGTAQDTFTIQPLFFKKDTVNVVIIWPTGGKVIGASGDSIDTASYVTAKVYLNADSNSAVPLVVGNAPMFRVFPNPASGKVNIQMGQSGSGYLQLTDLTGKLILSKPYNALKGETITLPLNEGESLSNGLYLLVVVNSNGRQVSKLYISR